MTMKSYRDLVITHSIDLQELTDVFTVMEFDFSHPIETMEGVTEV